MQATITWQDNVHFIARGDSGHDVSIDGAPDKGGQNLGSRPMELVLMGLGGCASFDVVSILKKSRQNITDVQCRVTAQRSDDIPAVFTAVHLHFVVTGEALKDTPVKKGIDLAVEKYCSVSKMLVEGGVQVTHDYEIVPMR